MENLENESEQTTVNDSSYYIEALKEMKQNSVSREDYDKLKQENKQLIDALVQGKEIDIEQPEAVDVDALRRELYNSDKEFTNLEYMSKSMTLRDELLARGDRDPMLPTGTHVKITNEMIEQANNTARIIKECIAFADGDSGIFTAELQRRTREAMPAYARKW